MDDWRLTGQEQYLKNKRLKTVTNKDIQSKGANWHEHCEFCMDKISINMPHCFCTTDEYRWICPKCFSDFQEMFEWTLEKQ